MKLCIFCRHHEAGLCNRTAKRSPVDGEIYREIARIARCDSWLASKFYGTCGETGRHFEYRLSVIKP